MQEAEKLRKRDIGKVFLYRDYGQQGVIHTYLDLAQLAIYLVPSLILGAGEFTFTAIEFVWRKRRLFWGL